MGGSVIIGIHGRSLSDIRGGGGRGYSFVAGLKSHGHSPCIHLLKECGGGRQGRSRITLPPFEPPNASLYLTHVFFPENGFSVLGEVRPWKFRHEKLEECPPPEDEEKMYM